MILSSTAYAAGSLSGDICANGRTFNNVTYQYTGGCSVWDVCDNGVDGLMADQRTPSSLLGCDPGCLNIQVFRNNSTLLGTYNGVNVGDSFTVPVGSSGNPNIDFFLQPCNSDCPDSNCVSATMRVHMSCSQSLCVGDKHGYFLVTGSS